MNVLTANHLDVSFCADDGSCVHAVDDVSFALEAGEFVGLVGRSGCGKSTTAKVVAGLLEPDAGSVEICGRQARMPYTREVYRDLQMVFQMPKDSFNPRQTVGGAIVNAQRNFGASKAQAREHMAEMLAAVGLDRSYADRLPRQLSGGECQRAAIARAFAIDPKVVICDEATSALDVSVQAQIVELLRTMSQAAGVAVLFISHDIALVKGLCSRMMVMHDGVIVEEGPVARVVAQPQSPWTQELLDATFI